MSIDTPLELATALGYVPGPLEWRTTSIPPIPMYSFGKDHWSTFAYVETRTVDHKGRLEHDHMRCDEGRHPTLARAGSRNQYMSDPHGSRYPTRLANGVEQHDHDDYDCLDDLIEVGLLQVTMPDPPPGVLVTGLIELELAADATWSLTERGHAVAARLRAHLAAQRSYARFMP